MDSGTNNILDMEMINELREVGDDMVDELRGMFFEDAPELIETIKQSVNEKDSEALSKSAHKLKGMCLSMGASYLAEICLEMEKKGKQNDLVGVEALLIELDERYKKTSVALESL